MSRYGLDCVPSVIQPKLFSEGSGGAVCYGIWPNAANAANSAGIVNGEGGASSGSYRTCPEVTDFQPFVICITGNIVSAVRVADTQ